MRMHYVHWMHRQWHVPHTCDNTVRTAPANEPVQSFEVKATTINMSVLSSGSVKLEKFDVSAYNVIIFDEVYFNSRNVQRKMEKLVEKNRDKFTSGTADALQPKPILKLSNINDSC